MRTELTIVASRERTPRIDASGGITARLTGRDAVHLIGTAATPLGGDHIDVRVRVDPGAVLVVRSVAATIALPSRHEPASTAQWYFDVDEDATLIFEPQPTIVASFAQHRTITRVRADPSARIVIRERVQIGRSREDGGYWSGALHVDVDKRPRLRHRLEVGESGAGSDTLFAPRALESTLRLGPDVDASARRVTGSTISGATVTLPLVGGGTLATWLGDTLRPLT